MPGLDFNNFCWGAGRKDDPYGVYDSTVLVIPCGEDITKHDGWKEFNKVYNDCSENYYSDNVKANSAEIYFNHEVLAKKNETDDVSLNVYFVVKGADLDTTIEATAKNDEGLYFAELTSLKPNTTYSFGAYGSMSLDTGDGEVYTETFYYYNKESEVLPASFTTLDKSSLSNAEQTNTFTIYPNPAKEVITLDLGQLILDGADAVVIFNSNGQVVYKSNIKNPISNIKISDFESGVYYVKVRSEVKKLIVE